MKLMNPFLLFSFQCDIYDLFFLGCQRGPGLGLPLQAPGARRRQAAQVRAAAVRRDLHR